MSLDGRTALVTGASSGIGAATVRVFAREGADVALLARREERLADLAAEIEADHGVRCETMPADLRDEALVEEEVNATVEAFDGLDVLVNNAGLARGSEVDGMATDAYRAMMETNVDGTFYATRAALPHLRESEGNLVFVGSFAGHYPRPFNPVYAATKWWVRGFAHSLAAQVGPDGVGVSVVNPSEVRTEFTVPAAVSEADEGGSSDENDDTGARSDGEQFAERYDPGEATEPVEVAEAIAFAAGQRHSTVHELDLYRRDKFEGW